MREYPDGVREPAGGKHVATPLLRCELARLIASDQIGDLQVVVLRELGGAERAFQMQVGFFEAAAIQSALSGERPLRPMTHDLLAAVTTALGAGLKRLEVLDIRDEFGFGGTFFGALVFERGGGEARVDCRPSDGVALALRLGAEIWVAESVFEKLNL